MRFFNYITFNISPTICDVELSATVGNPHKYWGVMASLTIKYIPDIEKPPRL